MEFGLHQYLLGVSVKKTNKYRDCLQKHHIYASVKYMFVYYKVPKLYTLTQIIPYNCCACDISQISKRKKMNFLSYVLKHTEKKII